MKLNVHVKPNSKHAPGLEAQTDGTWVLYLKEQPIEGRANTAAVAAIAKHFGVAKSAVQLTHGATSRHKVFEITLP